MAQQVFISHSSKDSEMANTVCQILEERGLPCWIAPRDVPPGAKYGAAIVNAIEDALAIVFIFSEHSNNSEQVMNEIERSVSKKKPIFPLKISPIVPSSELEYFISRRHWLDLSTASLDATLQQLADALQALQAEPAPAVLRGGAQEPERLFVLEASREGERLKISAYEHSSDEARPLRHYAYLEVSFAALEREVDRLVTLLNQAANNRGTLAAATWQDIKTHGETLYQQLLTPDIQEKLKSSTLPNLLLHLDDALIQIPWELLFDGNTFLCRRFNIGRFVSTQQALIEHQGRHREQTLKMLVIADPQGNLEAASQEGDTLQSELASEGHRFQVDLRKTTVDTATARALLAQCDVLHYAGHADYDAHEPSKSAWLLADGKLSAAEILRLGEAGTLPALVFCNACQSGQTTAWKVTQAVEQDIYGLAHAFLLAGARHYIGSLWKIPDEPSHTFALGFYRSLAHGATIGTALREARQQLISRYGEESVVWASYVLYGDPTARYLAIPRPQAAAQQELSAPSAALRSQGASRASRKTPLLVGAGAVLILLVLLGAFLINRGGSGGPTPNALSLPQRYRTLAGGNLTKSEKESHTDRLVADLLQAYKAGIPPTPVDDGWTSRPLVVALLRGTFESKTGADEALLNGLEQALRDTGRFTLIERELLDKILAELKLGATDLVDRQTAARVGRIIGASLLATGRIIRRGAEGLFTVRLFDTETTEIVAGGEVDFTTPRAGDDVVKPLADNLLQKMRQDRKKRYLLRGEIVRLTPTIILNIGAEQGVTPELLMEVVEAVDINGKKAYFSRDDVGRLKVTAVHVQSSTVEVLKPQVTLQQGWKVREIYEQ